MNPVQPRKKKSRTANSTYCTLKTLTNIIANDYAGSNRKGDMRKKWLILASCVRYRTSHHALARSVQLSPRRRAAASARSRLQGAYRCTHAGLRPPSRARARQPTTRTGPNVRSPYLNYFLRGFSFAAAALRTGLRTGAANLPANCFGAAFARACFGRFAAARSACAPAAATRGPAAAGGAFAIFDGE